MYRFAWIYTSALKLRVTDKTTQIPHTLTGIGDDLEEDKHPQSL